MPRFQVSARGMAPVDVESPNWLSALGIGLDRLGVVTEIDRLACEVLPNGTVIARDVRSGAGYVVMRMNSTDPDVVVVEDDEGDSDFGDEGADDEGVADEFSESDSAVLLDESAAGASRREGPPGAPAESRVEVTLEETLEAAERRLDAFGRGDSEPFEYATPEALALMDQIQGAPTGHVAWRYALESCRALIESESGAGISKEPDDSLRFVSTSGPVAHLLEAVRLPADTGIAGFCIRRQVSLVVTDPHSDPRFFADIDKATGYRTGALLCVPVSSGTESFGCLQLLNPPIDAPFRRSHIDRVEAVAEILASRLARGG